MLLVRWLYPVVPLAKLLDYFLLPASLLITSQMYLFCMQLPTPKAVPIYVPEFVRMGLGLAIILFYDGRIYDDFKGVCHRCGSRRYKKFGFVRQLFAKIIPADNKFLDVRVRLQRYKCLDCRTYYVSNGPFYKGTLYGSQIVDFALMLSMDNSSCSVERIMTNFGIQLGSDAILDYNRLFAARAKKVAPLTKEMSAIGVNLLKVLFGVNNVRELGESLPEIDLQSLADETYPRKKGALKKFVEEVMGARKKRIVHRHRHRGLSNKDIVVKDGKVVFPESFTLALSYMPGAEAFASLICTEGPFNQILAGALWKALEGSSFTVTDGSNNYNEYSNRVRCTVHKTRNELKKDTEFKKLKKEAKEGRITNDEVKAYAKARYQEISESTLDEMRKEHPEYFDDDGNFHGHTTTNGMEGGNWRIKYAVRALYSKSDTMTGRSILACVKDSIFTIRGGMTRQSLANKIGFFKFSNIMMMGGVM
jgi:hypothetical protein